VVIDLRFTSCSRYPHDFEVQHFHCHSARVYGGRARLVWDVIEMGGEAAGGMDYEMGAFAFSFIIYQLLSYARASWEVQTII
jgi:hypothetical protein